MVFRVKNIYDVKNKYIYILKMVLAVFFKFDQILQKCGTSKYCPF